MYFWAASYLTHLCRYRGLSPAEAEFNYLNTARTLELYGVELHYARVSLNDSHCNIKVDS